MNAIETQLKNFPYTLILGSASPRRQALLKGLGFDFTVKPTHADESFPDNLKAEAIALFLAGKKSDAYTEELKSAELLITADTIVWCEGKIYNKPVDFEDGMKMLGELSGRMHEVFTAVCLRTINKRVVFCDTSKVYFKPFTKEEIAYYLVNFKPYDKAGAYGVQDWLGYTGIEKIEGSFYNVMGLPVKLLFDELMNF
jgi:septum formation protein